MTRLVVGLVLGALVAGGCAHDNGSETIQSTDVPGGSPASVAPDVTTSASTPTSTSTTTESTTTDSTTGPVTTTTGPVTATTEALSSTTSTVVCDETFGVDRVSENFPQLLSGLVGRDIRTGAHPCFERVVIELQGPGDLPGYRVEYVPDPVRLSPSDLIGRDRGGRHARGLTRRLDVEHGGRGNTPGRERSFRRTCNTSPSCA